MKPVPSPLSRESVRASPEQDAPAPSLARRDDHFYQELTRTNNELTNLQREMARKHAELVAAQQSLQLSEQRYRSLSACSPIGVLEMDVAGHCLYCNPHWEAATGLTPGESAGHGWRRVLDDRDAEAFLEAWNAALSGGYEFSREFRYGTVRGDSRWAQLRSRSIRAEPGELAGRVSTFEDITDRKRAEIALEKQNKELIELSRRAGMAEVAAGVLHHVGNALNSLNVTSTFLANGIRKSKAPDLEKVVALFRGHEADLGQFLTEDPKGRQVPGYLAQLAGHLAGEHVAARREMTDLQKHIDQIKDIVTRHHRFTHVDRLTESVTVAALVEEAVELNRTSFAQHRVEITTEIELVPKLMVEKHKVLEILVHLLQNATQACAAAENPLNRIDLLVSKGVAGVRIRIRDNGVGLPREQFTRIFAPGFTSGNGEPGTGLHDGANAARTMGGCLTVESDGPGQGATFTLELPWSITGKLAP